MKRMADLLRVNETGFTAIIIAAMTIAGVISLMGNLGTYGTDVASCLYDIYIVGVLHMVSTLCVPVILFYIIFVERFNQRTMQVIRELKVSNVWKRSVIDLLILCVFFTLYVFVLTTIVGLVCTKEFYNWGEIYSRCAAWTGKVCEEQPSFIMLLAAFLAETFETFLVTGIVMLGVWWCTNKEWAGYITAIALITIDKTYNNKGLIFAKYYISGSTYRKGIHIGMNIVYPLIVALVVFVIVNALCRLKKKEFLGH